MAEAHRNLVQCLRQIADCKELQELASEKREPQVHARPTMTNLG